MPTSPDVPSMVASLLSGLLRESIVRPACVLG